jgi:hypothetical protein
MYASVGRPIVRVDESVLIRSHCASYNKFIYPLHIFYIYRMVLNYCRVSVAYNFQTIHAMKGVHVEVV